MQAPTYTKTGAKSATATKLQSAIFDIQVESHELLKSAYLAHQANGRENHAVTLTRGLVRGGGRKPWKQKGTGRARFGSIRVPIWRGGGVTFGPTGEENYSRKINVKAKRQAIRQALSLKSQAGVIHIIESLDFKDGKTKEAAALISKLNLNNTNTLLVVAAKTDDINRATQNIQGLTVLSAKYLNTVNLLDAKAIVIVKDALEIIEKWLVVTAKPKVATPDGGKK